MDGLESIALKGSAAFAAGALGYYGLIARKSEKSSPIAHGFLPGPSNGLEVPFRVREVRVRHGEFVDRVEFHYSCGGVAWWGGEGGTEAEPFVLADDEHIIEVKGWNGNYLDSIQFVTSTGREYPQYGGSGGPSPYSMVSPDQAPIGGLQASASARGWLRTLNDVVSVSTMEGEVSRLRLSAASPAEAVGFVSFHRKEVRRNVQRLYGFAVLYLAFILGTYHQVALECLVGPVEYGNAFGAAGAPSSYFVELVPFNQQPLNSLGEPHFSYYLGRGDMQQQDIALRLSEEQQGNAPNDVAYVRATYNSDNQLPTKRFVGVLREEGHGEGSTYYLDTGFSKHLFLLVVLVATVCFAFAARELVQLFFGGALGDPSLRALARYANGPDDLIQLMREVEGEVANPASTVLSFGEQVAVTESYIIKASWLQIEFAAILDCKLVSGSVSRRWMDGEYVELVKVRISNSRGTPFDVQLPRELFAKLENSFLARVRAAQQVIQRQREDMFVEEMVELLRDRLSQGLVYEGATAEGMDCLGGCGRGVQVKIVKRCDSCPERTDCFCQAGWCHLCLLKWWLTQNQTKIEMEQPFSPTWQAKCPTCRAYFCLNDLLPLPSFALEAGGEIVEGAEEVALLGGDGAIEEGWEEVEPVGREGVEQQNAPTENTPRPETSSEPSQPSRAPVPASTPSDLAALTREEVRAARMARFANPR